MEHLFPETTGAVRELGFIGLSERYFDETPTHPHYQPAPHERREALLRAAVEAMRSLPYIEVQSSRDCDDAREMLRLHLTTHGPRLMDQVQDEIRHVWKSGVVRSKTSLQVVRTTPLGFDLRFALLDQGFFFTGVLSVIMGSAADD